jgi:hypothetical protein
MSMIESRLIECKPWKATFERSHGGKDGYHSIIVVAENMQQAMMAVALHLPKTDCVMTGLAQMEAVRGVII